ncbi:MAG: hypothetical protein HBSIN02_12990 [Bacteroidia bacterium]|nr:MAG: hypothetical protein HBSIN02_12990 [Bacteroidia bacterium]
MTPIQLLLSGATALQRDILSALLYFDIFGHPLSSAELYRFLPSNSTSQDQVAEACRRPPLSHLLREKDGLFCLANSAAQSDPFLRRRMNERRARKFLTIARTVTVLFRCIPFVRGVMISGELSKGVLSADGDIDYVIITAPRRLWVSRTLCIAFKKLFLFNSKKFFCVNHFVSEDNLPVEEHNVYTALELITLRPLHNSKLHQKYLSANSWVHAWFPNAGVAESIGSSSGSQNILQLMAEIPFRGRLGDLLDRRLLEFWKRVWDRRYPHLSPDQRRRLFRSEKGISTAYAGDFLTRILLEYEKRLKHYGLGQRNGAHD